MDRVRVFITEGDVSLRENVRALLEGVPDIEVAGEASGIPEMMTLIGQTRPDVVLLNDTLDKNSHALVHQLKVHHPEIKILGVNMADGCDYYFEVPPAGSSGYMVRTGTPADFLAALRGFARGTAVSPTVTRDLLQDYARQAQTRLGNSTGVRLTRREEQILKLTVEGNSNEEIAARLSLSTSTVRTYRASVMSKLGFPTRSDLAKYALKKGFIALDS
ncbi:MAG: response regulator transcription factor [Dehalococcoidia bacterium]|nr:response regulator transcription factor [Dehalococcoidia bacterium]